MSYICPVCQYRGLFDPPYDESGIGSDEICPCCGFQFGCDDFPDKEEQMLKWKKEWIQKGCKWFSAVRKPPLDWNPKKYL